MALLHNPRLSRVLVLCVLGVLACGVALALAGPTPKPPEDPLDALPTGVLLAREWTCAQDLAGAVTPTVSTTEVPGPTEPTPCWHIALVRSPNETPNELADRLTQHFTARGFEFTGTTTGDFRSLTGVRSQCGTMLAIDTGEQGAFVPPGARATLPTGFPTGLPGADGQAPSDVVVGGDPNATVVDPNSTVDPSATVTDPNATVPDPNNPGVTTPTSVMDPATDPGFGQPPTVDPSKLDSGTITDPSALISFLQPTLKGGVAIVASQQTRAVVPRSLEGTC